MKLSTALAEKFSALTGGKNVTAARMAKLLDEVEQGRKAQAELDAVRNQQGSAVADDVAAMELDDLRRSLNEADTLNESDIVKDELPETPRPEPDEETRSLGIPFDAPQRMMAGAIIAPSNATNPMPSIEVPAFDVPGGMAALSPLERMMIQNMQAQQQMLQGLTEAVKELRKPVKVEEKNTALIEGKLPPSIPAPMVGAGSLPRGSWFNTKQYIQAAPEIPMKICACPQCPPHRLTHYYCVVCRRGPFPILGPTHPKGRHQWLAPGATWGVMHECCSPVCYDRYQAMLGVVAGHEFEPLPTAAELDGPNPRTMPVGSD